MPQVTLTLEDVTFASDETVVEIRIEMDAEPPGQFQSHSANPVAWLLIDEQGRQSGGRRARGSCNEGDGRLVCQNTLWFEPVADDAETLTLEVASLDVRWPATEMVVVDLEGRQPGDRWPLDEELNIMGMTVPLTEAAWVTDPDAPDGYLSMQLVTPCVAQADVQLIYLETWVREQRSGSGGVGNQACDRPEAEQLVAAFTVDSLRDGRAPAALEKVEVDVHGRLPLQGPWTMTWNVER